MREDCDVPARRVCENEVEVGLHHSVRLRVVDVRPDLVAHAFLTWSVDGKMCTKVTVLPHRDDVCLVMDLGSRAALVAHDRRHVHVTEVERFLLFLLLDFNTVGKNQNRHAWFSII